MQKVAFFDLDGTIRSTGSQLYPRPEDVAIYPGVADRLQSLRSLGYSLVGVTNQGGVSKGVISGRKVEAAIERTQQLLGDAALDLVLYCPHDKSSDGLVCDCKKPAPGMILDALTSLSTTLVGSFVVGDDVSSDGGMASVLGLPYIPVNQWMSTTPEGQRVFAERFREGESNDAVRPERVAGALVGLAVGDALGAPLEFKPRLSVRRTYPDGLREMIASHNWRKGQYTDDTEMALLIADSLLENVGLRPADIAKRFHKWAKSAKDVGIQTRAVVNANGYLHSPEGVARSHYQAHPNNSAGNGAVMRCAPVALFWLRNLPMLLGDSRRSARLTHGDPKAQSSCVILNSCIREAILHGIRDARSIAMHYLTPFEQKDWGRLMTIESMNEDQIKSSGYTVHTIEAAFWSFLTTDSFEEAVVRAANLGDDADTVAAVTGALAGSFYGYDSIPRRWLNDLEGEKLLSNTALKLAGSGE
jgi:ADP-ribosyl-[dinitrogen reductase] hydrolase